ncbi:hypothetical protein Trydic_g8442 [Trypoxylus dichotomus]
MDGDEEDEDAILEEEEVAVELSMDDGYSSTSEYSYLAVIDYMERDRIVVSYICAITSGYRDELTGDSYYHNTELQALCRTYDGVDIKDNTHKRVELPKTNIASKIPAGGKPPDAWTHFYKPEATPTKFGKDKDKLYQLDTPRSWTVKNLDYMWSNLDDELEKDQVYSREDIKWEISTNPVLTENPDANFPSEYQPFLVKNINPYEALEIAHPIWNVQPVTSPVTPSTQSLQTTTVAAALRNANIPQSTNYIPSYHYDAAQIKYLQVSKNKKLKEAIQEHLKDNTPPPNVE